MNDNMADCVLPSSAQVRCLDRFSILDDDFEGEDGLVPFWALLQSILSKESNSSSDVVDILDTVSNCRRGSSGTAGDFGMLKQAVETNGEMFFSTVWPNIVQFALSMPEHFPTGKIEPLKSGASLHLSRAKVGCLVAHQFLCTVSSPSWRDGFYDFSVWYDSSQRHPQAVKMYLEALLKYFERLDVSDTDTLSENVEYSLHSLGNGGISSTEPWCGIALSEATVVSLSNYSTEQQELQYQEPNGAVVVSANKDIGFGQSATQEELYVGNCPEACPAVLITPTLRPEQVLVINGARPMLRITGQRREISWSILEPPSQGGRMLFMDALEIDEVDENDGLLPDLKPQNLQREILKAYTAFSSWQSDQTTTVWSGVWGCGAFNGDPGVKMCILWIAASLAGKQLQILCDGSHGEFPALLERFIGDIGKGHMVEDLRSRLHDIPGSTKRLQTMEVLLARGLS